MAKKINPDFKPDERSYNNLRKHGAIPEFVDHELPMFITYFLESGAEKKSWQMTLQRWMRSAWIGKAGRDWEYNRHNRERHSKPKGDLFGRVLDEIHQERKGDRVVATTAHEKREPPLSGRTGQYTGGRESAGMESSNLIASRSSDKCLPPMTFEEAQKELKKMGIIKG